jgi:hypothetical protein
MQRKVNAPSHRKHVLAIAAVDVADVGIFRVLISAWNSYFDCFVSVEPTNTKSRVLMDDSQIIERRSALLLAFGRPSDAHYVVSTEARE